MKKLLVFVSFILLFAMLLSGMVSCFEELPPLSNNEENEGGEQSGGNQNQGTPEVYTEGLEFKELEDGTYEVSRGTAVAAENIVIPSTYNGKAVTAIAAEGFNEAVAFETEANVIKTVTIPSSVTKIGRAAFANCVLLTEVNIPSGVTEIVWDTFANCQALENIVLPEGITKIGERAFMWTAIKSIAIPSTVKQIDKRAFKQCEALESIVLPSGLTTIATECFTKCTALKYVTIPSSVTAIEKRAFLNCENLQTITFLGTRSQWDNITKGDYWATWTDTEYHAINYTLICNQ